MNLIEALEAAAVEYHEGADEDEIYICCPFCTEEGETPDERFRLGVNVRTGKMHCFNCEKSSGNADYTFREIQRALDTGAIETQQERRQTKKKNVKIELPEDFEIIKPASESTDYWNNVAYRYLRRRGITRRQITEKQIGYSMVGDMHHRVVFPVFVKGRLKGLVGRDFTEKQDLKYKNSVGEKAVYNVAANPQKSLCLVEGVFDTLCVERGAKELGIDTSGLLGHSIKDGQLWVLEPYDRIILWLDPDAAGIKGVISIAKKIQQDKRVDVVLPNSFSNPDAKDCDPSDLSDERIIKKLRKAKPCTETLLLRLKDWLSDDE